MTGNAAEIVRVRFRFEAGERATGPMLARMMSSAVRLGSNPYVVEAWNRWLEGVGVLHGIELLDLFYRESYSGSFAATGQTEYDIVQEAFTPYDCRVVLTTMLGVDERYRQHDRPKLYVEMIRRLWPEVLCEPVNRPCEGKWTPVLRALRSLRVNRLVSPAARRKVRRVLGIG